MSKAAPTPRRPPIELTDGLDRCGGVRASLSASFSPDFNPIEQTFGKIKQYPRCAKERTYDEIVAASKSALNAVTATDTVQCYLHAVHLLHNPPGQPLRNSLWRRRGRPAVARPRSPVRNRTARPIDARSAEWR